jgi:hypothetical protein
MPDKSDPFGETELLRIQFLDAELDLCQTFIETARIELKDDPSAARRAIIKAGGGYEIVVQHLPSVTDPREHERLRKKLSRLGESLASFVDPPATDI